MTDIVKPFEIIKMKSANPNDERGSTYELKFPGIIQVTTYERKKGSTARHYHKGRDDSKNPEILVLIKGKMKIIFKVDNQEPQERILTAGTILKIWPLTKHTVEFLEDSVFIELRVTHFDPENPDTYTF